MSMYMGCDLVSVTLDNHEIYYSKGEIQDEIDSNEKCIEDFIRKIVGLVCGDPVKLLSYQDEDGTDVKIDVDYIIRYVRELMDSNSDDVCIRDLIIKNVKLNYIKDNWDKTWNECTGKYYITMDEVFEGCKEGWHVNGDAKKSLKILKAINDNRGCRIDSGKDIWANNICPCRLYRNEGKCTCGLYIKDDDNNNILCCDKNQTVDVENAVNPTKTHLS